MSIPSPALENTSPVASVRSSGAPNIYDDVPSATPSTKSTAITPSALAQHNGIHIRSQLLTDDGECSKIYDRTAILGHAIHADEGSDPNTPRLPPTMNGKYGLEDIPQDAAGTLDTVDRLPGSTYLFTQDGSKQYLLRSPQHISNFSSSISEPGSKSLDASCKPFQQAPHFLHGRDRSSIRSWLEDSHRIYTTLPQRQPATPSQTQPMKFHGRLSRSQVLEMSDQEPLGLRKSIDDERPLREREEILSDQRNRSSSRSSQGRVEKQIQATLAEADQSSHVRSRKSSHTFGLFKENSTSPDTRLGWNRSRTTSDNSIGITRKFTDFSDGDSVSSIKHNLSEPDRGDHLPQATDERLGSTSNEQCEDSILEQPRQQSSREISSTSDHDLRAESDSASTFKEKSKGATGYKQEKIAESSKSNIPSRLLEEIRGYHNLAAPFHDKFRSTQPKLTRPSLSSGQSEIELDGRQNVPSENSHVELQKSIGGHGIEEDDSEHISSALYYPHQAPSPDALQDVSIGDARQAKTDSADFDTILPEPALSADPKDEQISDDIDISLQVHNESRHLHGDLHKARPISPGSNARQPTEGSISSASESDYESLDEGTLSLEHEGSNIGDDGEATPRASPKSRKSYLLSRRRKAHRAPAAPLGAVELKPYNHQVGGHTTVFRFSKRAVCKQLSNRENEFYEVVEREHPDLLKFLPR